MATIRLVDLSRAWEIKQRNGEGFRMGVQQETFEAAPNAIGGQAFALGQSGWIVNGHVTDRHVEFIISWDDGKRGEYRGSLYDDGYLRGISRNLSNPGEQTEWWSVQNDFRARDFQIRRPDPLH